MKNQKNNDIAKAIKVRRKKIGITQKECALMSGLGLKTVRDIEQGKLTCQMFSYLTLASFLGVKFEVVDEKTGARIVQ